MTDDSTPARPVDAAIPAAVRTAFANPRLQGAWSMISAAQPGDRQAGLEAVFRLLAKDGLTFADVMTTILSIKDTAPTMSDSFANAFAGFGESFFGGVKPQAKTPPKTAPVRRDIVQGADVPKTVTGSVKIQDERGTRNGMMLVFSIETNAAVYGPLVCFTSTGIGALKAAAEDDRWVTLNVRQPNGVNQMPSVTGVRIV